MTSKVVSNVPVFHFGLTPEHLTQAHVSRPWNPLIAQVLYRAGIIERWGNGAGTKARTVSPTVVVVT